jgi:hypothetical protein
MSDLAENDEEMDGGRSISRSEIEAGVQAAFEMCATCAHTRATHDGGCQESSTNKETGEVWYCRCVEFWPFRQEKDDGLPVTGYALGFGGAVELRLTKRAPTELWEALKAGEIRTLTVKVQVGGRGYSYKDGGLTAKRKLEIVAIEDLD